jgi:hypothetical protein
VLAHGQSLQRHAIPKALGTPVPGTFVPTARGLAALRGPPAAVREVAGEEAARLLELDRAPWCRCGVLVEIAENNEYR